MFGFNEADSGQTQRLHLVWAPIANLEVGIGQRASITNVELISRRGLQVLGDPSLHAKFTSALMPNLAVGAQSGIRIPTSQSGSGLAFGALGVEAELLATYTPRVDLEATAHLGYQYDRSSTLLSMPADAVQRFAFAIGPWHRATWGVGGVMAWIFEPVSVAPWAEVTGEVGQGVRFVDDPLRAGCGVKLFAAATRLELNVGVHARILGAPRDATKTAGLPPGSVFAQLTARLDKTPPTPTREVRIAEPLTCQSPADCQAGQECSAGSCVLVREVIKEIPAPEAATLGPAALTGAVLDATTGKPVPHAMVQINGSDMHLEVSLKDGTFVSWPLPLTSGLVQLRVSAPAYAPAELTIARSQVTEQPIEVHLKPAGGLPLGVLTGSLKDRRTGKPVEGTVFVPALKKTFNTDAAGNFRFALETGRFQVLVSAKGYVTQKKDVALNEGDVVILNVDLMRSKGH